MTLRLHVRPFRLRLRLPLATAHGSRQGVEGLWLLVADGTGAVGLGEVTPLPAFGTESLPAAAEALGNLRLSQRPECLQDVRQALAGVRLGPASRAGVEMALLDLLARREGVALATLLGAPGVHPLPVSALLTESTVQRVAEEASSAVASGFGTLKLKLGVASAADEAEKLQAIRQAVGPTVRLRGDANGAWTEAEATARLSALAPVGLEYVEQPVSAPDIAALRRLRKLLPLAADEALGVNGAVDALLDGAEGPAADVFILKLPVLGGLLDALALAGRARARGVDVVVTGAMDGGVGRAAAGHLALTLGGTRAHGLATGALLVEDPGAHAVAGGSLQLTDAPGLGVLPEAVGW